MKVRKQTLASIAVMILIGTGCSTQEVKRDVATEPASENAAALALSKKEPPGVVLKGDKPLNLVRLMDGAVCKSDQQGAKGEFLLYADPADIDRIKLDKGEKIFNEFEQKIETFSAAAFEEVINTTSLTADPFALGEQEAHQKLAEQVARSFKSQVATDIDKFQQETTLTIDVVAYPDSFTFYRNGCDIAKMNVPLEQ